MRRLAPSAVVLIAVLVLVGCTPPTVGPLPVPTVTSTPSVTSSPTSGPTPQVSVSIPDATPAPTTATPTSTPTRTPKSRRAAAFLTPSRNIDCGRSANGGGEIACQVFERDFRRPACRAGQRQQAGGSLVAYLDTGGRPRTAACASDVAVPGDPVRARYGDRFAFAGGTLCTVATRGVRCVNAAGHGFELSRQAYRPF